MFKIEKSELELKFEKYLKDKASTETGKYWLSDFKKGGLTTIILVMHFIYDKKWMNKPFDENEEELLFYVLSKVKHRVFKEIF
jgi:hypothetical protein